MLRSQNLTLTYESGVQEWMQMKKKHFDEKMNIYFMLSYESIIIFLFYNINRDFNARLNLFKKMEVYEAW
jgi:hypothetical protein